MNRARSVLRITFYYVLPVALFFTSAAILITGPKNAPSVTRTWIFPAILVAAVAVSGAALALRILLRAARHKSELLNLELKSAVALRRTRETQLRTLRRDVELLSAIREIGVIVNADDQFNDVISKVLELVSDLIKAEELVLYLIDKNSQNLEPVARRLSGKTTFRKRLTNPPSPPGRVTEALEYRRMLKNFHGPVPVLTLPLVVEREAVGVLKAALHLDEEGEEAVAQIERSERLLKGLERHLALAIKTPSLYHRAVVDALTGLYSRRHFDNQLAGYFKISQRRCTSLGFIMCDIDHFKMVNDTYGHQTGDVILHKTAKILLGEIREYDSAYRYGGEEMCIILPQTEVEDTLAIAERIRNKIEKGKFKSDKNKKVPVTLSLGVGAFRPWMKEPSDLIGVTDAALYKAKDGGRNLTVIAALEDESKVKKPRRSAKATKKKAPRKSQKRSARKKKGAK